MSELDILIDGIIAYGFVLVGYALWLEVFGIKCSKPCQTRTTKTSAPLAVSERHISLVGKVA